MFELLNYMQSNGGVVRRYPGGFWRVKPAAELDIWWGVSTVDALVKRGVAEYFEHQQNYYGGSFPVAARLL